LNKTHKCIDCGIIIDYRSIRCHLCANKNNLKNRRSYKGKNNPAFKHGAFLKDYSCKKCGTEITIKSGFYGSGLCRSCEATERCSDPSNNPMFGKHHTKEAKIKMSEKRIGNKTGKDNPNWQGGIWNNLYPIEFNDFLKESIRDRDGHKCQHCGKIEVQQIKETNKKLHIHHIDYNKQNCKEDNLITLCNKCNNKANYNRDFWFAYYNKIMEELYSCLK
jgi:hypothetical protein